MTAGDKLFIVSALRTAAEIYAEDAQSMKRILLELSAEAEGERRVYSSLSDTFDAQAKRALALAEQMENEGGF